MPCCVVLCRAATGARSTISLGRVGAALSPSVGPDSAPHSQEPSQTRALLHDGSAREASSRASSSRDRTPRVKTLPHEDRAGAGNAPPQGTSSKPLLTLLEQMLERQKQNPTDEPKSVAPRALSSFDACFDV